MRCFWLIVSVLVLILIGGALAVPVIEQHDDSVLAILTDLQSGNAVTSPYTPSDKEAEARKTFDEMLVKAAAEADKTVQQRIDMENASVKRAEADEERLEELDREKIAKPPVHMTPEEEDVRLAMDKARRDMNAAVKTSVGQYASQTIAAKNTYEAEVKKIGDSLAAGLMDQNEATEATHKAGTTFQAALQTAIDQQTSAIAAAQSDFAAADKNTHDRMTRNLNRRQFVKLQEEAAEGARANELAEERLREKLAVKVDAEVKGMEAETHNQMPPRKDEKEKTFSEMMTEMVEVFQEVDVEAPRDSCDEAMSGNGVDYRGCQTKTRSGFTCRRWDLQDRVKVPDMQSNYCRNDDSDTIWCYTTEPDKMRWEYCNPLSASPDAVTTNVMTATGGSKGQWVTTYKVETSTDCTSVGGGPAVGTFTTVDNNRVFTGNEDPNSEVWNTFNTPVQGVRCVRLLPQTWNGYIAMQAALLLPAGTSVEAELRRDQANVGLDDTIPDMTSTELKAAMTWIKQKTLESKVTFCWKDSYGRGAGSLPGRLADCPPDWRNVAGGCLLDAWSIAASSITATCGKDSEGLTNMGLTCQKWSIPMGTWGPEKMNCDKYPGYFKSSITQKCHKICDEYEKTYTHPVVGTFRSQFTSTGETCYRGPWTRYDIFTCRPDEISFRDRCYTKSTGKKGKAGDPLSCNEETTEDFDNGLCYLKCRPGYRGIGPVCWQDCAGLVDSDCAMGCALNTTVCLTAIKEQVLGPIILAANIVITVLTMGASTAAVAGGKAAATSFQVGIKMADGTVKTLSASTKIGEYALKAVTKLQNVKKTVQIGGTVTKWTKIQKVIMKGKEIGSKVYKYYKNVQSINATVYEEVTKYQNAVGDEFAEQTSKEIDAAVNYRYGAGSALARFVKKSWSDIMLQEMSVAMGAETAANAMSIAAAVDPTGVLDVVNAYNKPKCVPIDPMPCSSLVKNC